MRRELIGVLALCLSAAAQAEPYLYADGFEAVTAYRMSDLDLRDPHVFVNVGLCVDITDNTALGSSFNSRLQAQIQSDSTGDGLLDASFMQLFRPFSSSTGGRVDSVAGSCLAPLAGTTCARDPQSTPQVYQYITQSSGTCLGEQPGTLRPYSPPLVSAGAPCLVSDAQDVTLSVGGISFPAKAAQFGAHIDTPASSLSQGVMRAFVRESDANTVILPQDLPLIGGRPLSSVLAGGTGSCAAHSDKDTFQGDSGWWFYFNYPASSVPWTEG